MAKLPLGKAAWATTCVMAGIAVASVGCSMVIVPPASSSAALRPAEPGGLRQQDLLLSVKDGAWPAEAQQVRVYPCGCRITERSTPMTYHADCTLPTDFLEQMADSGLDAVPEAIRLLINAAMRLERQKFIGAGPYQRPPE